VRLKHGGIEIPENNPFVNDKLEREKFAEVLTSIIETNPEGFVLAIDNKWGTGKTTFVKMWRQHLINEGYETLYFNAWANDFQEEVIVAFLSELEELKGQASQKYDTLLKKSARFFTKVGPAVAKGVAAKAIGQDAVSDIVEAATEFALEELEVNIAAFTEKKKGIEDFRKALADFVAKIDNEKPVVFFIDELDRCNPHYSVKVLERVKHFFNVHGIVFVLSIDKEQLESSIKGYYGSDHINAKEYLRRFIDLEYQIPKPNKQMFIEYLYDYFEYNEFLSSTERNRYQNFKHDGSTLKLIARALFSNDSFTLRKIEKILGRTRLVLKSFRSDQYIFPELLICLAYLAESEPDFYAKIRNASLSFQEVNDKLENIFEPLLNRENLRRLTTTIASFLVRYELHYNAHHLLETKSLIDTSGGQSRFTINSRLYNDNEMLFNTVKGFKNLYETSDLELSYVLNKYDLTENLRG
jgi:hypothetical protein